MRQDRKMRRRSQEGIALLIAIFVLLLISVVAIALLVSSGTETALGANYRSSSTVYYGALAGLEEARGRLLPRNPNYLGLTVPALVNGTTLPWGQAIYLVNRLPSETIVPWDPSDPYYDKEYQSEFGVSASPNSSVSSVWDNSPGGIPGPVYKWVRINAATEVSLHLDVNQDGNFDPNTLLFYDPAHIDFNGNPWPSLIVNSSPPSTASQALEVTALAALPNGSQKILQYLVAPVTVNLSFPAALTLDGYSDSFSGPNISNFQVRGDDDGGDSACSSMAYPVPAIGVPDSPDISYVKNGNSLVSPASTGIPGGESGNFTGTGATPNVVQVALAANLQSVQSLDQISQTIIQNADSVIAGPANQSNLPSAMSSSNPMTVAVQGDFSLGASFTGYGLLLVTGKFTYDTGSHWNGVVLVIGKGNVAANENGSGGSFNGAMLVAQTVDSSGNPLPGPNPGTATFTNIQSPYVGTGIFYSCSFIKQAEAPLTYKVLSFHEIPQQ
jgi:hypothetical protein